MDRITKEQRSRNMSRIRGKNTKPEMIVRRYLFSRGLRYRLHAKLPGKPDIVMKQRRVAIFINGCFWHGHNGCKYFRWPQTRTEYWREKIGGNIKRDLRNYTALQDAGWRVLVVWECDIKQNRESVLNNFYSDITQGGE